MKPSSLKKVFGIISYFPDNDSDYHIEMRRERSRRFRELLAKLEELWGDIDILVIAQNWQDFELPKIKNKFIIHHYNERLGIVGARKELRKKFLETDYDYLIMLDDDAMIQCDDPQAYLDEIDKHPDAVGAIRWRHSCLQFFAISKAVYSQIEMTDIDPEKSQGFEDDVFAAQVHAKFKDIAFDFPKDLVKETSLRYNGPGKCPSTWSREKKYNWENMYTTTDYMLYELSRDKEDDDSEVQPADVDVIITYVNNSDTSWVRDFVSATKSHNPSAVRFRSWGTLKYLFRGIAKNMPFVRNVILVVSKASQVPIWVNTENVRIVYHEDFIPEKYLPTFNSCTIESFFWRIPDLADRIIYFNDDIFPLNKMKVGDFFTNNTPHIKFIIHDSYNKKNIYRSQCRMGLDAISDALHLERYPENALICPEHSVAVFY